MGETDSDLAVLSAGLEEFHDKVSLQHQKMSESMRQLQLRFKEMSDVSAFAEKSAKEMRTLETTLQTLQAQHWGDDFDSPINTEADKFTQLQTRLKECKQQLAQLADCRTKTGSHFLRFVFGRVNTKVWSTGERLRLKDEYNKFKTRTTWIFLMFPLFQLLIWDHKVVRLVHYLWLLYYYASLSIRENILQVNGSHIKSWWIIHHYFSMAIAFLVLVTSSTQIDDHLDYIQYFLVFQGVVTVMQIWYQKRRHKIRVSIGKAKEHDIATSETLVEKPHDLKLLVPLLYTLYTLEIFGGFYFVCWLQGSRWVNVLMGAIWIVIGVGNLITTSQTLFAKAKTRKQRKRSSSFKKAIKTQ